MGAINFNYHDWRERKAQSFDKENITLTKAGKTFNVYDAIQENREDTEIYPTLEKYGCIDRLKLDREGIFADFTNFKGLREMKEQQIMADQMFYSLPLEIRQKFNNDKNIFMKDGEKYFKDQVKAEELKEAEEAAKLGAGLKRQETETEMEIKNG